jgi:hypothetical protein
MSTFAPGRPPRTEIDDRAEIALGVAEKADQILGSNLLAQQLLPARSRNHPRPLLLGQPAGVLGEVGQQEEGDEGDDDGDEALEDEEPAPVGQAGDAVHVGNGAGEQAAERAGDEHRAPEEGEAFLGLVAFVPEADQVEACGASAGAPRLRPVAATHTAREDAGFGQAQQEAGRQDLAIVLD